MAYTVEDQLALIEGFLAPVRGLMGKEAAADSSVSFKDTSAATPENQAKQDSTPVSTNQRSLGNEQSQEAKDGGGNVENVADNSEEKGKDFADDKGPKTLDTDQSIKSEGNLGALRGQEITQEQKEARAGRMANSILHQLEKKAMEDEKKPKGTAGGKGEFGDEYQNNMKDDVEKEASVTSVFDKYANVASQAAQEYYECFLHGMLKRAQDHEELNASATHINQELLQKVGGISGLLDKVAEDTPEAVLPEGVDMEYAEDEMPLEAPVEDAGMGMEDTGAMPEGGGGMDDIEGLAAALDEAGVAPEEIAQAQEDLQAIIEAGVAPEELAQALSEIGNDAEGAGAAEEYAMEEKVASCHQFESRARVDWVKSLFTSN